MGKLSVLPASRGLTAAEGLNSGVYCCGSPAAYEYYEGVVTLILENNRWAIDDFVALQNRALLRLSDVYPECKGGKWADLPKELTY